MIAKRDKVSPEEALLAHVQKWLENDVPEPEPGVTPAPPGMFPNDSCEYSFSDPTMTKPARAEDYLKPKQRLDAIAENVGRSLALDSIVLSQELTNESI